jgi:uncharacterized protein (DUF885 family)
MRPPAGCRKAPSGLAKRREAGGRARALLYLDLSAPIGANMKCHRLFLGLLLIIGTMSSPARSDDTSNLEARRKELNRLLADEWEYEMRESPQTATTVGDYRNNDKWDDASLAHASRQRTDLRKWLARFESVNTAGFPEQEKLSQIMMIRGLKQRAEAIDLKLYLMPVDQFWGIHLSLAQFVINVPFKTTKQYDDYLARLHKLPQVIDQVIGVLRAGEKEKLLPPAYLLDKTIAQCSAIAEPAGVANAFGQPVSHFPDAVTPADQKRLHDAILAAVDSDVRPAYRKLQNFLSAEYAPKGRKNEGVWSLPNGDQLYRFYVRQWTTTSLDPETIHQLGLNEVTRIQAAQLAIAKQLGFADLKTFQASLKTNPKLVPASGEQILEIYRGFIAQMEPQLPKYFGLRPKAQLEVKPVEKFREKDASSAEYNQGTADGSRPAVVMVNTGDYQHRTTPEMESTAYHEGVPGHHMQISIAQTLPEMPKFRQEGFYSAYEEGWALYAEQLGKELGFYQDPYSDYGRLEGEMLRAVRLVLDTGVHYKHWTRQQMVDYFHEHTSEDEPDVQAETDRYIAIPGQALGYKLGQLDILKLRKQAQDELGNRYDVRAFHDEILNGGAMPLDLLDQRVSAWIAQQKAGAALPQ